MDQTTPNNAEQSAMAGGSGASSQMTSTERTLFFVSLLSKATLALAVILFIAGFAMYSGFNDISGVSLMGAAPMFLILYPVMRGFEIVIRAAARYLQINGEPYGK